MPATAGLRLRCIPALLASAALACSEPSAPGPTFAVHPVTFATYDGSGQVVHPDVAAAPLDGPARWLAVTPYPFGDSQFENPSIFHSADGLEWRVPPEAPAPLARPDAGYFSDPDVVYLPESRELRVYFRQVVGTSNRLLLTRSDDGIVWSTPTTLLSVPSHTLISPAVVRRGPSDWELWTVNSGAAGCTARSTTIERRRSSDGLAWGEPETVALAQPAQIIWHIEIQWIEARQEYWALYNTFRPGSTCVTPSLFLARSRNGRDWTTYPGPVLQRGEADGFGAVVYRSTFRYDAAENAVQFWYSGATYADRYHWSAATERIAFGELLARIESPRGAPPGALEPLLPPPELADMPVGDAG
jgi:hypothetical protein